MADIRTEKLITAELNAQKKLRDDGRRTDKTRQQYIENVVRLEKELKDTQTAILKTKAAIAKADNKARSLAKDMSKLLDSQKGKLLQSLGVLDKTLVKEGQRVKNLALQKLRTEKLSEADQKRLVDSVKGLNAVREVQDDVLNDFESDTLENIGKQEILNKVLEKAGLSMEEYGSLGEKAVAAIDGQVEKLEKDIKTLNSEGLKDMVDAVGDIEDEFGGLIKKAGIYGGILKSKELRGTALKAGIAAAAFSFAKGLVENAKELKQELGLSVGQSAVLGAKVSAVEATFTKLGMRAGEVKAFSVGISQEFGNIDELSLSTLNKFAEISRDTGISGENAAKLAKSIQIIQGGSLDASLSTIEVAGNLAAAAGVSKKLVLEDIAQDAENFAKFAKDGGRNIATAAVSARRLGLSLGNVADIASNLLDFESSIESQMEASVLLGRQLNLDKARELALTGDLAGLAEEVKNQVGSQADFEAMNVIERQSLAKAIGVSVADLGKIVAGEKTSAELAEKKAEELEKQQSTQFELTQLIAKGQQLSAIAATIQATISSIKLVQLALSKKQTTEEMKGAAAAAGKAAVTAGASAAKVPIVGPLLALAAIATVGGAAYAFLRKKPPGAETGGIVTESGLAQIHKGEAISGTKNELGFGNNMKETNNLLQKVIDESRQLRTENKQLMNTLTGKVGEMAMSS
jgi:hypothetical protein